MDELAVQYRLDCLKLALDNQRPLLLLGGADPNEAAVATAQKFADFVIGASSADGAK